MTPFLDESALESFAQSILLLVKRVRSEATPAEMHDLTATQRSILLRLEAEGPAISAALARAEGITPQSMGTALCALDQRGFVERTPHPTDGRQTLISLTSRGRALRKATREAKERWLHAMLSALSDEDRQVLLRAGDIVHHMLNRSS